LAEQARVAGATDRQVKALLETVPPLTFVDYRQARAAIEQAQAAGAGSTDPIVHAFIDVYRAVFGMFLHGWSRGQAELMRNALPKLSSLPDLRLRGRFASMEAAMCVFGSEFPAACESAEASRQYCRKAGAFFDYYVATLFLNWALLERGNLGQALRIARDGCELAARNGSSMPLLWLKVRQIWVHMEAFDYEVALAEAEPWAANPQISGRKPMSPFFLWVGMARYGARNFEGAERAFEKVRAVFEEGGVAFQV